MIDHLERAGERAREERDERGLLWPLFQDWILVNGYQPSLWWDNTGWRY